MKPPLSVWFERFVPAEPCLVRLKEFLLLPMSVWLKDGIKDFHQPT